MNFFMNDIRNNEFIKLANNKFGLVEIQILSNCVSQKANSFVIQVENDLKEEQFFKNTNGLNATLIKNLFISSNTSPIRLSKRIGLINDTKKNEYLVMLSSSSVENGDIYIKSDDIEFINIINSTPIIVTGLDNKEYTYNIYIIVISVLDDSTVNFYMGKRRKEKFIETYIFKSSSKVECLINQEVGKKSLYVPLKKIIE